jgi:hypothetical protein
MNFVYPAFLYAFAAVAIPIIIHLFNFQRPKRVLFTNVQFLKQVIDANQSKLKLKHLLILLSRIGFISFLVLLFAQPFIPGSNKQLANSDNIFGIYLDNSPTMFFDENGYKRIDLAKNNIFSLSKTIDKSAHYFLLENSYQLPQKNISINRAKNIVPELNISYTNREIAEINDRFNNHDSKITSKILFSDFQKKQSEKALLALKTDTLVPIFLIPMALNESYSNVFIDSVWTSNPFVVAGKEIEIFAKITNLNSTNLQNITSTLIINDIQTGTNSTEIEANTSSIIKFKVLVKDNSELKCKINITDNGFYFDNDFYFVINPINEIKIVEITNSAENYIKKVYSNNEIFSFEQQQINNLQYSTIENVDLIILNQLTVINSSLAEQLLKHQQNGGSITFIPADNGNKESYTSFLATFGINLTAYYGKDTTKTSKSVFNKPDINSPFFSDVFEKTPKNIDLPFAKPILAVSGFQNKVLQLKDNQSFLVQKKNKGGAFYLFTSPISDTYSNFAKHSLFVPVMYKMAQFSITDSISFWATLLINFNCQKHKKMAFLKLKTMITVLSLPKILLVEI